MGQHHHAGLTYWFYCAAFAFWLLSAKHASLCLEGRSQGPSATPDKVSPWHLTTNNFAQKNAPASCR